MFKYKVGFLIDKILHESFIVNDDGCFKMKTGEPYSHHSSVENKTAFGVISWPYAFKGDFIKLIEWDELPKNDYDVVMVAIEKFFGKYPISMIRKAYPNAIIIGTMKENSNLDRNYNKIVNVYNQCDAVIMPFYNTLEKLYPNFKSDVTCPVYHIAQPYDIEYLYNKFYTEERNESIFSYIAPDPNRHGETERFAAHLGQKFGIPVVRQAVKYFHGRSQWHDFLKIFSSNTFNVNCDPASYQGHQGIQSAIFGIVNVGGMNDSHQILWPETATLDLDILEQRVEEYITNPAKRIEVLKYAWKKLWEYYSYDAAQLKLINIMRELEKNEI